jgi:hypothetical protein
MAGQEKSGVSGRRLSLSGCYGQRGTLPHFFSTYGFGMLKPERIHRHRYPTLDAAKADVFGCA